MIITVNKSSDPVYERMLDDLNTQPVQVFHLLMDYPDGIYFLPGCGATVVAEQDGGTLFIADVITSKLITFDELITELPFSGVEYVEFGFCPDWLGVCPDWKPVDEESEPFFIRGKWDLPDIFRFPAMSNIAPPFRS